MATTVGPRLSRVLLALGATSGAMMIGDPALAAGAGTITALAVTGDDIPGGEGKFFQFSDVSINDAGQIGFYSDLMATPGGGRDNAGIFWKDGDRWTRLVRSGQAVPDGSGVLAGRYDIGMFSTLFNRSGTVVFPSKIYRTATGRSDRTGLFLGGGQGLMQMVGEGQAIAGGAGTLTSIPSFMGLSFNDAGDVLIRGRYEDALGSEEDGVLLVQGTNITVVATTGDTAGAYNSLGFYAVLNHAGQIAFVGSAGSWGNDTVLLKTGASAPTTIARPDQAVGGGTLQVDGYGYLSLNEHGHVAFSGRIGGDAALLRGDGESLSVLVREGQPGPGGEGQIEDVDHGKVSAMNPAGQVAFVAGWSGGGGEGDGSTHDGILLADGAGLAVVARTGDAVPGANGKFDFEHDDDDPGLLLNAKGQVLFRATLVETSGGYGDNEGIFLHDAALGLMTVARRGDALLGSTIVDLEYSSPASHPGGHSIPLNGQGQVVFEFDLNDGRSGIAVWTPPSGGGQEPVRARINYDPSGRAVVTSWPAAVVGATLESTTNLANPSGWSPVDAAPVPAGTEWRVTQPVEGPERFYRLRLD